MSTILDTIVAHKRREVASRRELLPVKLLETSLYFNLPAAVAAPVSAARKR